MTYPVAFLLITICNVVFSDIPTDSVLEVIPMCGIHPAFQDARMHLVTDLEVHATAVCKSRSSVTFAVVDHRNQLLDVAYKDGNRECVFNQRTGTQVYTLNIDVFWNVIGQSSFVEHITYQIVCAFDEHAHIGTIVNGVWHDDRAGKEIKGGNSSNSNTASGVDVIITDVTGAPLQNPVLHIGRKVRLLASGESLSDYKGLMPISCNAVSLKTNKKYAILRAGCGDGVVLSKTEGFTTTGFSTLSPVFKMFHLFGDKNLLFHCNFTLCRTPCDGSSCLLTRNKRSALNTGKMITTSFHSKIDNETINITKSEEISNFPSNGNNEVQSRDHNWPALWVAVTLSVLMLLTLILFLVCFCCNGRCDGSGGGYHLQQ